MKQSIVWAVPNVIGYFRIVFFGIALFFCFSQPILAAISLFIAETLDIFDGYFARKLKQCSAYGEALDMLIDRACATTLFIVLIILYPTIWLLILAFALLENISHMALIYASQLKQQSHKAVSDTSHGLLKYYYSRRVFLCFLHFMHGVFLGMCYLYYFFPENLILYVLVLAAPFFLLKAWIHGLQLLVAMRTLVTD